MTTKQFIQRFIISSLIVLVTLGSFFGISQAIKYDLERQRQRDAYMQSDEYKKEQEHRRQIELIKAQAEAVQKSSPNETLVKRETEQVIKDRLIEKGTDIGVNLGLNLLNSFLNN